MHAQGTFITLTCVKCGLKMKASDNDDDNDVDDDDDYDDDDDDNDDDDDVDDDDGQDRFVNLLWRTG